MSYQSFRTMVVRFLATRHRRAITKTTSRSQLHLELHQIRQMPCASRDFHYALSPEEFNAIMFRIEALKQRARCSVAAAICCSPGWHPTGQASGRHEFCGFRLSSSERFQLLGRPLQSWTPAIRVLCRIRSSCKAQPTARAVRPSLPGLAPDLRTAEVSACCAWASPTRRWRRQAGKLSGTTHAAHDISGLRIQVFNSLSASSFKAAGAFSRTLCRHAFTLY